MNKAPNSIGRASLAASFLLGLLMLGASQAGAAERGSLLVAASTAVAAASSAAPTPGKEFRMWVTIGEHRLAVTLADTAAARAFAAQLPLTLRMDELNGNEKHATLPKALPSNASRPGTLRNGDVMLYGTNTLVLFYLTFDSPYSYTRIGRLEDPSGLPRVVGSRDVQVRFSRD
jgi:hypothetical protein